MGHPPLTYTSGDSLLCTMQRIRLEESHSLRIAQPAVTIGLRMALVATLQLAMIASATAQQSPAASDAPAPAPAAVPINSYPDSTSGLTKLMKDLLRAAKSNDAAAMHALLGSMVLPDREGWFLKVFGSDAAQMLKEHPLSATAVERILSAFLNKLVRENFTEVVAYKHEESCDDNSGEEIYPALFMRQTPVPLYEVRFRHGAQFFDLRLHLRFDLGGFRPGRRQLVGRG